MIKLLLVCFFISFTSQSLASSDVKLEIDSLLAKADDLRSKDPQQFNELILKLNSLNNNLSSKQEDYLEYLKGYQLAFNGDFNQAELVWERISAKGSTTEIKFRSNLSLINIYAYTKEWSKGLSFLEENLKNLHLINNPELSQLGISAAAIFYNQIGQYELGLKFANQLDSLMLEGRNLCVARHQIAESKFHLKILKLGSEDINNAIASCSLINEPVWQSAIHTFRARLMINNKDYKSALEVLTNNVVEIERVNYIPILSHFYALMAKAYLANDNQLKAKVFGQKSIELTDGMSNTESEVIAYDVLYKVLLNEADYESALMYYIKFAEADKAYFDDLKTKYLAFQLAQHKAVEQKVQIELLNKQNKLLQASQRLSESETENNRLFMALLIMVISLLAIAAIRSNRNQKRLKHLAEHDSLTQIYNRGHFTSAAQDAMQACQINQDDISCILFDLDKFKTINDNYGHACGDWVLKNVASTCKNIGRKNDIFARLGGEEFCVILSRCDANTAMKVAEDYRKAIAEIDSAPSGNTFPITASFGVTDSRLSGYSLEALTGHADNAMYLAKDTGRNQVCSYRDVVAADDSNSVII
ncbi:sensor domain-containing diguanylate cyclase [Shewanella goraebulensis]|uniref:sensor domain-containing diguanylate cyclase n=1 Tax=Shewanella goraebulensis TaxID=3050637 RepID=UPI00254B77E3|nr:GGDEF domain-containing protein [Shewanella goraebulensis]